MARDRVDLETGAGSRATDTRANQITLRVEDRCDVDERECGDRARGGQVDDGGYESMFIDRSRSALATTDTELRLMAAAAIIGLSRRWLDNG